MGINTLIQDARVALRGMKRNPGAAALVVLTLGLGIGSATAVFTVVDAALLQALPFTEADRLVDLTGGVDDPAGFRPRGASYPEAEDWRSGNRTLEGLAAWSSGTIAVTDEAGREAELLGVERVTAEYFDVLRVPPAIGRTFTAEEHRPDGRLSVILSDEVWQRRFGGDPDVLGRTVLLAGRPWTVVGVTPPGFRGLGFDAQIWVPLELSDGGTSRGSRYLSAVGRLRPGVSVEEAAADLRAIADRLAVEFPETHRDRTVEVTPLRGAILGDTASLLTVLLAAVGFLVLIASANVANLLLVRAGARRREFLVRRALGAGHGRVAQHAIVESILLAVWGAGLGWMLAAGGVEILRTVLPSALLPAYVEVGLNLRAMLFAGAVTTVVGVLAGMAPILAGLRSDPAQGLREGGAATAGRTRWSVLQPTLATVQIALALVLLVGTGLMVKNLQARLRVDPGVDAGRVLGFRVTLPEEYVASEALLPRITEVAGSLERIPGVERVAWMSDLPLVSGYSATYVYQEGRETDADRIRSYIHRVGPGAFDALGIRVLAGRAIDDSDLPEGEGADAREDAAAPRTGETGETGEAVGVISAAMARRYYGDRDPVGSRLRVGSRGWIRIVGVAEEVRYRDLTSDVAGGEDDPDLYLPFAQFPGRGVEFAVRVGGGADSDVESLRSAESLIPEIRTAASAALPGIPLQRLGPLADGIRAETAQSRFGSSLLALFGLLAVVLAAVGVYGVMAISVTQRKSELAVRMAVGASGGRVLRMVVRQGMTLAGLGLLLGLVGALLASRRLEAFLFAVEPTDPATYLAVTVFLAGVALAAVAVPAFRATRVEPRRALASE